MLQRDAAIALGSVVPGIELASALLAVAADTDGSEGDEPQVRITGPLWLLQTVGGIQIAPAEAAAPCALRSRCTAGSRRIIARHPHETALQSMHDRATPDVTQPRRCVAEHRAVA